MNREGFTPSEYSRVCAEFFAKTAWNKILWEGVCCDSLLSLVDLHLEKTRYRRFVSLLWHVASRQLGGVFAALRLKCWPLDLGQKWISECYAWDRVRRNLYGTILASARIVSLSELPCHLTVIFQRAKRIAKLMWIICAARVGTCIKTAFLLQKTNRPLCNLPRPM